MRRGIGILECQLHNLWVMWGVGLSTAWRAKVSRRYGCASVVFAAALVSSLSASAADIVGKVLLSGEPAADIVVSVEDLKLEEPPEDLVYVVDHRGLTFVPHVLVVRVGSTVEFKNSDGMPCRFYSVSLAGIFVLRPRKDHPMAVTFDRPGVVVVRCAEHSRLYAYIVIKENPYFAVTDSNGQYRIPKVPPGRYTLQAWYEGTVIKRKAIQVEKRRLRVDFRTARPRLPGGEKQGLAPPLGRLSLRVASALLTKLVPLRQDQE
ncbi:MAG: carboxypeptidase regulatory-like domain-containing protein [Terriglobia bacterium]